MGVLGFEHIVDLVIGAAIRLIPGVARIRLVNRCVRVTNGNATIGTDIGKCVIQMCYFLSGDVTRLVVASVDAPLDVVRDDAIVGINVATPGTIAATFGTSTPCGMLTEEPDDEGVDLGRPTPPAAS